MNRITIPAAVLGLLLALPVPAQEPAAPKPSEFAVRSTDFAFRLHKAVEAKSGGKNVFLSPTSILLALGMTSSGARGETRDQMVRALGFGTWGRERLDGELAGLMAALEVADPKVKLEIANSLWASKDFTWDPGYFAAMQKQYRATIESVDLHSAEAPDLIDGWAKAKTHGKIPTIAPRPIPTSAVMFLLNAVYFKGDWTTAFDKGKTLDLPFHLAPGKDAPVPFMTQKGRFQYLQTPEWSAVRIPYGEKKRTAFYVVLPSGTSAGPREITGALWREWAARGRGGFAWREGVIQIPRFKMAYEIELVPVLQGLGMRAPFGMGADFSGMSPGGGGLCISSVLHKTFVDVNEEGTEAAAVTQVTMSVTSAPPPPFQFTADRPFFCAIVDDQTGAILFTGSIVDPR